MMRPSAPERPVIAKLAPPVSVRVDQLLPADSPRLDGEDEAHTRMLADSEADLPPILVHRATMRVIDGMHRLRAAALRGEDLIQVRFFDGPADEVFVLAVEANIVHGLPLSLRDRERAAARILDEHPEWSDRSIARASGLSARTVGVLRRRQSAPGPEPATRVGRDGRVRPLNNATGRRLAGEFLRDHPTASLREIASRAGISLSTARDVRERVQCGKDPVLPGQQPPGEAHRPTVPRAVPDGHRDAGHGLERAKTILANLRKDPALRFSESGRVLLRTLEARVAEVERLTLLIEAAPVHCSYLLIEFAQQCAEGWNAAADRLKHRLDGVG